jgi:site-specific DNA-methyltransferase (adenine-specific)
LWLTDPPYNVNYQGTAGTIQNDNQEDAQFHAFLVAANKAAVQNMKPGAAFYIWHADSEGLNFRSACEETGLHVRECLIWVKNSFVLGHSDYQWRHEPCLYGWKDGAAHYFTDSRSESTVIPDLAEVDPKKMKKDELIALVIKMQDDQRATTVIEMDKPSRNGEHPTMKPVALFDYLIRNSTKKGEIVLDSFGGSGTTIMACEQDGRKARVMEIDPKYADVIIRRWEEFTGKKAVLMNTSKN